MELDGLRLEEDGCGSASLTLAEVSARLEISIGTDLGRLLTKPVEVIGIRLVDGDGRELDPAKTVVIVGFRPADSKNQDGGGWHEREGSDATDAIVT